MRRFVHVVSLLLPALGCAVPATPAPPATVDVEPAAVAAPTPEPPPARAPVHAPRDVAALLRPIREKHDVPAMAGAIVAGDVLEALGADGVRERGKPDAVTVNDKWHLGSCTKSMTATLCALLVEDGTLTFETTVGDVFGDVEGKNHLWFPVTLDQLLRHHAGAPASLDADGLWGRLWSMTDRPPREQRRALVEGVLKSPPIETPGTHYLYSNAGVAIAGAMAEKLTDTPWETLITRRLFAPLGMTSAGFGAPGTIDALDQPRGHGKDGRPVHPGPFADNPAAIGPAGTAHMSIGDWAKYVALHLRGERADGARLLKPETFVRLHAPWADESHYAMGWAVLSRPWAGGRVLTHSGSNTMWFCTTWIAPERDFAVLVCCNQAGDAAAKACDEACGALIRDHQARAEKK